MSKENDLSLSDIVSVATFAVAVITAWLYMIGWTYAYQYFLRFRISLLMIDIPLQHYLVYGGLVLSKNVWLSLGAVVVALSRYPRVLRQTSEPAIENNARFSRHFRASQARTCRKTFGYLLSAGLDMCAILCKIGPLCRQYDRIDHDRMAFSDRPFYQHYNGTDGFSAPVSE